MEGLFEGQKVKECSIIYTEIVWLQYVYLWRQWNSRDTAAEGDLACSGVCRRPQTVEEIRGKARGG